MPRGLAIQVPCPMCQGTSTRVVATKHTDQGLLVRRRCCEDCDHRWYTLQTPEEVLSPYRIKWTRRGTRFVELVDD